MEPISPELQEVINVIRREHRRTQIIFGISIIILAVVVAFVVPGIINMESNNQNTGNNAGDASLPGTPVSGTTTATGTPGA